MARDARRPEVVVLLARDRTRRQAPVWRRFLERGYRATALIGGYDGWRNEGLPLVLERTPSKTDGDP